MPSYRIQFENTAGQASESSLTAPSLPALVERLGQHDCRLLRVIPRRPHRAIGAYWRKVSDADLITTLRQLALSIENGVSVAHALTLVARETHNYTLRAILTEIARAVCDGEPLSAAMSAYPRLFPDIHLRLLDAAERGNRLPAVLSQVADYADRTGQAAQRIRTALVYPQVVGTFTLLLMTATFVYIVPRFIELFHELGVKELPFVTRALIWASAAVIPSLIIGVAAAGVAWWVYLRRQERHAAASIAELRLRLPVLGTLYHNLSLLRLTRLLAALLCGGVPLLEALRLAGQAAESPLLQAAMWDAIPRVAAGESLSAAFGHAGILPPTFCGQIAAAEASGDLPGTLARLSDWYSDRVDYLAARAGALIEPLCILVLALLAGWVALGVFAPMVGIIQSLSGGP